MKDRSKRKESKNRDATREPTWTATDLACKRATGFHARDIANPLLAETLDPGDDALYDAEARIVANLIGSAGDINSRAAAAALVDAMRKKGLRIELNRR